MITTKTHLYSKYFELYFFFLKQLIADRIRPPPPQDHGLQKAKIRSTVRPSRFTRSKEVTPHLEAAPVAGVACGVGDVVAPPVGVALSFAVGEVAEAADGDDDCVGPEEEEEEDELMASSVGEELSLG